MKTSSSKTILATALTAIIFLSACFNSVHKVKPINPAFAHYIAAYTSGMISRKETIKIELTQVIGGTNDSVEAITSLNTNSTIPQITLPDSMLLEDIFEFEPAIKGKAIWTSNRTIEFIPSEPMPSNQFYDVSFKLSKLIKVKDDLEVFEFQFSTYTQTMNVTIDGLRSYDEYDIEWQKLTGRITTSDYEDTTLIKQTLTALVNDKKANINWSYGYNNKEFYFYIDSIKREEKKGLIDLSWDGEAIKSPIKNKQQIIIPAMGDFNVSDVKVEDNDDQTVEVYFSDPLQYNQNLKGIITINGIENLTYDIETNKVIVYLPNRVVGDKTINITNAVKNFKGFKMNVAYSTLLTFEEPKPKVRIKGEGSILPNSKGLIFPFEAISLKAVDVRVVKIFQNNVHQFLQVNSLNGDDGLVRVGKVIAEKKINLNYDKKKNLKQWNTHVIDLSKLIKADPGSIYRVSIKYSKDYALCDCPAETNEDGNSNNEERDSWNEDNWHSYNFDGGYDSWNDYYEEDNRSACDNYYYSGKAVSRNIIASDLGMIYKLDDNKMSHAFITNMITTQPIANCSIEYYDFIKQTIAKGTTDANGMLDVQLSRKPFLMVATYGKQKGYLKLLDGDANSLSKFDIEGEVVQKGVKGFIYGERGVWRPGDSLYLNFIMEDKERRLPPNHPVKFELQDPNGQVIYQTTKTKNANGLYDFRTATGTEAITGNYLAVAKVGNRVFTQSIKIETVKPNRLKIYFDTQKEKITVSQKDTIGTLRVQWLHGAIAKNLHTVVNVSLNQSSTQFANYKNYEFDSPIRNYFSDATTIFDGNLNEDGKAIIKSNFSLGTTAPGMLRASFVTKAFEEGGDFSIDRFSMPFSPYKNYVGIKTPETKNYDNTLETGNSYPFDIASVDANGKVVDLSKVQIKIYKMQWRWWYERSEEDMASYISRAGTIVMKDTTIKTTKGAGKFNFKINYPEYGRYLITVTDLVGGHQTGKIITVDWPYWNRVNRSSNENANMLNFSCDKTEYTKGENIKLSFPSPSEGKALVSIETGTKVIKKFWINTTKGETKYQFTATADMSPNAYVHVTLLQPHANTKNDLPIRMYGVVPVTVDDPETHLLPMLTTQEVFKPESVTKIKVKEQHGRKMTYTLAIVDEGLLDLTRFKTPQPWNTFYAREALGVQTWDMYNAVIGAYAGKLDKLLSVGGDGDGLAGKGVKANRFKPMVKYMGPFTLNANQEKTHAVAIPNYVGSVRVMVIAENNGAYGNCEKAVAVRKPLMILATLPRVLGPTESVFMPVDIFAMENHVKDVKVEIEVNDLLSIDGTKQQSMHFTKTGDEVINFKLNVAQKIGIAKVKITATSGKEKTTQEIELDVRIANPKVVDANEFVLEPNASINNEIIFKGLQGTNKATIEVSTIPSLGLEKRLDYLIQYPHGCIEQTTSSVFPQLYVSNLMEMKEEQKTIITQNIKAGIKRLQLFQTSNGGFSYWPGEGYDSEWGSNYAGHFMIEAEKQGYSLPPNLKNRWIKYQQQEAKNWSSNANAYTHPHGSETNQHIQAYRLFVLASSNNAELGAMNRLREEKNLSASAKWRLAAAYKIIGQPEVAKQLINGLPVNVIPYKELSYSYGSDTRDEAMILETLSILKEKDRANIVAKTVAKQLNSNQWMSTQETAYSLLAMCEYAGVKEGNAEINFSYNVNDALSKNIQSKKALHQIKFNDKDFVSKSKIALSNTGKTTLFAKVIIEGIPVIGDKTASAKDMVMSIKYKTIKGLEIQPDKILQGTDFVAEVTITNPGARGTLKEMALNQIFASGWEIHNSRMDENGTSNNSARYQDIRDDRVYSYYELAPNSSKTFCIHLNATYLGKFYLPTIYTEAMYDNTINARLPGRWVEVVKDGGAIAMK